MNETLSRLADTLRKGQMQSKQGSYERRAPAKRALIPLREARRGLREFVVAEPQNIEAWRLLAQAEECLLDYRSARVALEQVMAITGVRENKDLKKLALLREYEGKWRSLGLTPDQLAALGKHLSSSLTGIACDHTTRLTEQWLRESRIEKPDAVLKALQSHGGYCDCEVVYNVVRG